MQQLWQRRGVARRRSCGGERSGGGGGGGGGRGRGTWVGAERLGLRRLGLPNVIQKHLHHELLLLLLLLMMMMMCCGRGHYRCSSSVLLLLLLLHGKQLIGQELQAATGATAAVRGSAQERRSRRPSEHASKQCVGEGLRRQ
jgi:hypothetical protein